MNKLQNDGNSINARIKLKIQRNLTDKVKGGVADPDPGSGMGKNPDRDPH
jgi:hypothetical protein